MKRRLFSLVITVIAVMLLTGCNSDQKDVTAAAEGFLDAIVNNDKETASQYATEEFMKSEEMMLMDPQYLTDAFFASIAVDKEDVDEEAVKAVDAYSEELVKRAYKSYEIQDIKVQDDKAAVTTKITLGYDPAASSTVKEETQELIKEYQSDHYDELISVYTEEGEKAMYRKLYNDLIPIIIGKMQEKLDSSETSEEKTIITLEKIEGKWLVTSLEENRQSAAEAVSAQEAAAAADTSNEQAAESGATAATGMTSEYASEEITSEETAEE